MWDSLSRRLLYLPEVARVKEEMLRKSQIFWTDRLYEIFIAIRPWLAIVLQFLTDQFVQIVEVFAVRVRCHDVAESIDVPRTSVLIAKRFESFHRSVANFDVGKCWQILRLQVNVGHCKCFDFDFAGNSSVKTWRKWTLRTKCKFSITLTDTSGRWTILAFLLNADNSGCWISWSLLQSIRSCHHWTESSDDRPWSSRGLARKRLKENFRKSHLESDPKRPHFLPRQSVTRKYLERTNSSTKWRNSWSVRFS